MSYHTFFDFSSGLSKHLRVPEGTMESIQTHVSEIETAMGIKRIKRTNYKDNPEYWDLRQPVGETLKDEKFCELASHHNRWVRETYSNFAFWATTPFTVGKGHQDEGPNRAYPIGTKAEIITPADAVSFWPALQNIRVPVARWSREYYRERMEALYKVMRGCPTEGITFDSKPLTPRQASAVIVLFSEFLDTEDIRLEVPHFPPGCDFLKASYDGGYSWCETCGAVDSDSLEDRISNCRRRKCPIKDQYQENI